MTTAMDAVKQSLLGTKLEPDVSLQSKATFEKHARSDDASGENYMSEEDFVNAIAPVSENYVSLGCTRNAKFFANNIELAAQDQEGAICHSLPDR